jgi:deoxyribodipyrimidine photo-lyase
MTRTPADRVAAVNAAPLRADGAYVLYWMIAARRAAYNFALQRATEHCAALGRPLVVLEALRCDYPHASDRLHAFALAGMADNAESFARTSVHHYPYVEPERGAGRGLLHALAEHACVVVTDEFPEFFLPRMVAAAGARLPVRLEQVDGNGLLPLRAAPRAFTHAHHFRRFVQGALPHHLAQRPAADPLQGAALPPLTEAARAALAAVEARWPRAAPELLRADAAALRALPIDHRVPPVELRGGSEAAARVLRRFVDERLADYADHRNRIDPPAASRLSPYLHWGFLSVHQVLEALAEREGWNAERPVPAVTGKRQGWWSMSPGAEAFLDELVTWRELCFNTSFLLPRHRDYASLPDWARLTLERHAADPRPVLYSLDELEAGATHDRVWNAAQGELLREGRIHNYLRMLWGKCILGWSADPREALDRMVYLNNRWALDGRNPSSWGGIFWCLGRYDRAWGPERPIFGTVRYMSSAATARKLRLDGYLARYAPAEGATADGRAQARFPARRHG